MSDEQLNQILDFDEADLAANRNGVLTERQRQRNAKKIQSMQRLVMIPGIVSLVAVPLACLLGGLVMFQAYNPRQPEQLVGAVGGLGCVVIMLVMMGLGFLYLAMNFKKPTTAMAQVEGPVAIVKVEYRSGRGSGTRQTRTELTVSGQRFVTRSEVGGTITPGEVWAIYYLKDNSEIMSMERVRGG